MESQYQGNGMIADCCLCLKSNSTAELCRALKDCKVSYDKLHALRHWIKTFIRVKLNWFINQLYATKTWICNFYPIYISHINITHIANV